LRPRFDALGGDPTRFHLLRQEAVFGSRVSVVGQHKPDTSNKPHAASIERETNQATGNGRRETGNGSLLAEALRQTRARLVIIDPLESVLAAAGIGPRSQKLRRLMDQFVRLAEEHQCCVLLVRNVSRSATGKVTANSLGSLELTGVVRSHLLAGVSPDNPDDRALVQVKSNLSALGPALGYAIDSAGVFHWTGASSLTPEELLSSARDADTKSALEEAEHFLRVTLSSEPEDVWRIQRDAKEMMIAPITLRRAKERLGIVSRKIAGGWKWEKPQKAVLGRRPSALGQQGPDTSDRLQAASNRQETTNAATENREQKTENSLETGNLKLETCFHDHLERLDLTQEQEVALG
jgi:hypothetical protein